MVFEQPIKLIIKSGFGKSNDFFAVLLRKSLFMPSV
jgi:hypothetical protein